VSNGILRSPRRLFFSNGIFTRYMIYQSERCPKTGRLHIQGYMELKESLRIAAIVKWGSGFEKSKIRKRWYDDPKKASDYCEKEESRAEPDEYIAFKFGRMSTEKAKKPSADERLAEVYDALRAGSSWVNLVDNESTRGMAFRYHAAIGKYEALVAKPKTRNTRVILHVGTTGMGKSRCACYEEDGVTEKENIYMYVTFLSFVRYCF